MAGLEGKAALITGAGGMRGVGRASALKLASLGADIAITDVRRDVTDLPPGEVRAEWRGIQSVAEEVEALGRRCFPVYCDLGDDEQIAGLVEQVKDHFGRIDVLVNNARAVIGMDKTPVTELSKDVWDHFLAINTTAVFLCTKLVGQEMVGRGEGGRIINIASNAAKPGQRDGGRLLRFQVCGPGVDPGFCPGFGPLPHNGERRVPRTHKHGPNELLGAGPGGGARDALGRVPQRRRSERRGTFPPGENRRGRRRG